MDDERTMGGVGESDDNRGGRHRGIVVEIPCKGQSVDSAVRTTEGNSLGSSRMLVKQARDLESDRDAKQKIGATI